MKNKIKLYVIKGVCAALTLGMCTGCAVIVGSRETSIDNIKKGSFNAGASVHDPSIIESDGKYYIFGSHMEAAKSEDLKTWTSFASGVNKQNKLFDNLFDEDLKAFEYVGKNEDNGYSVWAPDVIYNEAMGKYVMYFCTTATYVKSNLCFATADNIEGPYTYQDTILYSGFDKSSVEQTDFFEYISKDELDKYCGLTKYENLKWPNAIDPTVFYDADGKMWMTYGSWSGGIFILEIDEKTGYPIHPEADEENGVDEYFGKHLLAGLHNSVEGPYILYDEQSKYYYLFVSYGSLIREGGYQMRVFRSESPDGEYVDVSGKEFLSARNHDEYGLKLMGNYTFPSLDTAYMAPGHNSAFIDKDGKMYLVYHQRFDNGSEYHEPRIHQMFINKEGWPVAAPFAANMETISNEGYRVKDIKGTYYLVNHGTDISSEIHSPEEVVFKENGEITGSVSGSFTLEEGTCYITINIEEIQYSGVLLEMEDEAGNEVVAFSCAGNNNETIWGVHYK